MDVSRARSKHIQRPEYQRQHQPRHEKPPRRTRDSPIACLQATKASRRLNQSNRKDYRTAPGTSPKNQTETYRYDARQATVVNGVNNVPIEEEVRGGADGRRGGRTARLWLTRARPTALAWSFQATTLDSPSR